MILQRLGLLAFSIMFVRGATNQMSRLDMYTEQVRKAGLPVSGELARLFSWAMMAAGVALNVPKLRRFAALIIALQLSVVTFVGHRFWETEDPQQRAMHQVHAFKNLAMFGSALVIAGTK